MEPKLKAKDELISYLNSIPLLLLGLLFFTFPILIASITSDFFTLPKQILVGAVVLIAFVIFVIKMIIESLRLRRTIFDLPIILLILSIFLSSVFAVNRFDSLIALVPFLFAVLSFFIIVNFVREKDWFFILTASLILGGSVASIISILSFFKIYLLPIPITQAQTFTPIGSLLDQAIYLGLLLPIAIFFLTHNPGFEAKGNSKLLKTIGVAAASIILLVGFSLTIYQLFNPTDGSGGKLTILPFQTGFQTAFAAISQDTARLFQGFLFGSGFGTFFTDFTRFKQAAFNQNEALWNLTFIKSSSFVLELLATTGVLGLLSFVFLAIRVIKTIIAANLGKNPISISLLLAIIVLFILPVGFTIQTLFFILLAIFSVLQGFKKEDHKKFFDIELQLVTLKRGLFALETFTPSVLGVLQHPLSQDQKNASRILAVVFGIVILSLVGILGFFSVSYLISDITFQDSLVAASNNKGTETYQKQSSAISIFPYREGYYRVFSQTNLALANSLSNQKPQNASPSAETQRTIYKLIQQSINAGRAATSIAPLTSHAWQNLSSIYRSLIGFGQNAERFAIVTQQQAVLLDPNNPQGYIILGGIYYQLGLWENAQNQFQVAINLKRDFANGHYNLAHALENKGDLSNALREFQIVKTLAANDKNSLVQITSEIEALQRKIEEKESPQTPTQANLPPSAIRPLNLSTPSAQLPPQNPPVKIPAL